MAERQLGHALAPKEGYSRPSSACSDDSGTKPNGELESLLKDVDVAFNQGEGFDSVDLAQLEKFFRVCAGALAAKNTSRATTFPVRAQSRASTLDFAKVPAQDEKRLLPDQRERRRMVGKSYDLMSDDLLLRQTRELEAKQAEWQPVLDTVADVWRFHFPDCKHRADGGARSPACRCHPLSDASLRRKTQQDLVLARLCLEHDSSNVNHAGRFMPWLSLIGFKLEQIHALSPKFAQTFAREPAEHGPVVERGNIMTAILRYFYEGPFHYLARHNETRIGDMLDFCYLRSVLPFPESQADPVLEENFRSLIHGLWCLNILQTPRYRLTFTYPWNEVQQRLPVMELHFLGLRPAEAVAQSVEEIERRLEESSPQLPQAAGDNVRCEDLNMQALRNIGGLKIVWTTCDRDHLFLDQESGVLRLSFFNRVLIPEFYKYMPMLGRNDVKHTWELLLGHRRHQYDFAELERVAMPSELKAFNLLRSPRRFWTTARDGPAASLTLLHRARDVPDIADKYDSVPHLPQSVPYSYFGRYEDRLRVLRHYMDTRKPTGLRNLWHDRRDSLTYWTFWAVITFGGLSVVLAALGLAVGIIQAYASLKALDSQ